MIFPNLNAHLMDRKFCLGVVSLFSLCGLAQTSADSVQVQQLNEAVVNSAQIAKKTGGYILFPSTLQRKHTTNGLDLLCALRLPGVKIDPVEKNIISTTSSGNVIVLINGVESSLDNLQTLPQEMVGKVEISTIVPSKYGSHVAAVIDVRTRLVNHGYAFGANAMNALTTSYNDDGAWAKYFHRNATLGLQYNFKANDVTKAFSESHQNFFYPDGRSLQRSKTGSYEGNDFRSDNAVLTYALVIPKQRVVDVKGGFSSERFPERTLHERVWGDAASDLFTLTHSRENRTHLRAYYEETLSPADKLTLSVAGAWLNNRYKRGLRTSLLNNVYDVEGEKCSWRGEADFQHTFANGHTLNVGYQHANSFTRNSYVGTNNATFRFLDATHFAYAQWSGNWDKLYFALGLGGSRENFGESQEQHVFWTFQPNLSLDYVFNDVWSLNYRYEQVPTLPTLSELSAYPHQDDANIFSIGNAGLRGFSTNINALTLSFQRAGTTAFAYVNHEYAHRRIAEQEVQRKDENFWISINNHINTHHLDFGLYFSQDLWNRAVNVYVEPKFSWDKSIYLSSAAPQSAALSNPPRTGNGYFNLQTGLTAYWRTWSLTAYYRSASEQLIGPILVHKYAVSDVKLGYQWHKVSLSLGLRNAFSTGKTMHQERISSVLPSTNIIGNLGFRNMLYVSCSWSCFKGRQNKARKIKEIRSSWDSGIVK